MPVEFRIPFPPSINDMFLNKRGKGRILSPAYRAWKTEAGWKLKEQKVQSVKGQFRLEILLDDTRNGDCDNRVKSVSDLLVSNKIVEGDQKRFMRGVSVDWAKVTDCMVTIRNLD